MNIFLDTSSLVKLYHLENGSLELDNLLIKNEVRNIYLSEISKLEFQSAIYKKVRIGALNKESALEVLNIFETDFNQYEFLLFNELIFYNSKICMEKYALNGLRTLDAIQLATAISIKNSVDLYVTSDKLLESFFVSESLSIIIPKK